MANRIDREYEFDDRPQMLGDQKSSRTLRLTMAKARLSQSRTKRESFAHAPINSGSIDVWRAHLVTSRGRPPPGDAGRLRAAAKVHPLRKNLARWLLVRSATFLRATRVGQLAAPSSATRTSPRSRAEQFSHGGQSEGEMKVT